MSTPTRFPRRSLAGSAEPLTPAAVKRLLPKLQQATFEKGAHGRGSASQGALYEAGVRKKQSAPQRPLFAAALALLRTPTADALRAADLETLAVADVLVQRSDHELPFLGLIASLRGVAEAATVFARSLAYELTAESGGWTTAVWVTTSTTIETRWIARWLPLRHAVCAAAPEAYAAAVAVAHALRAERELVMRAPLAFVFPDEPWANDDLVAATTSTTDLDFLLSAASDVAVVREHLQRHPRDFPRWAHELVPLLSPGDLAALGTTLLPELLKKPAYGPLLKTPPRLVAQAIAQSRTKEVAAVLAPYAAHPVLGAIVLGFFRDAPELAETTGAAGKAAAVVARVVAKGGPKARVEVGEAPSLLRERPWRPAKKKQAKATDSIDRPELLGLETERVVLPEDGPRASTLGSYPIRPMTKEERDTWRREAEEAIPKQGYVCADYGLHTGTGPSRTYVHTQVPDADCLWAWNTGVAHLRGVPLALVKRSGLAALPGFISSDWIRWLGEYEGGDELLLATMSYVSPRVAPRLARIAARRKKYRRLTLAWLAEHANEAALGLVPDAVGPKGEARSDAEAALLVLAQRGLDGEIRAAAKRYGAPALAIVEALLARDPLAIDVAPPKRPDFLRLPELPAVLLRDGASALDADALDALVELLQIATLDVPYPGLEQVRAACDEGSLGALATELLEQWVLGDAPGRHEWMLNAAVLLPSEAGERRVVALAREWARKSQEKAKRACAALAALGTDYALMHLAHIADTTRFDALQKHARTLVTSAAEARGLSTDELGDRTVPDVGLAADGTLALSYGTRRFVAVLDETLRPVVHEVTDGGRSGAARSLPRSNKADDAEAVKVAQARFDRLKEDLEGAADRERRRLERAMVNGRAWSLADFRQHVLGHPLLVHVARRLVWKATSAAGARLFRIAEDRTLADVDDAAFTLGEDAAIAIAHPARDPALLEGWPRIFGDYEILQPFEQLGRSVHALRPGEQAALALERTRGIVVPARKTLGILEARGYRRDQAGFVSAFLRDVRAADGRALVVSVPLQPGFEIEILAHAGEQTTAAATLADAAGDAVPFGALDAAALSELIRDVEALRPT